MNQFGINNSPKGFSSFDVVRILDLLTWIKRALDWINASLKQIASKK